MLKAKIPSQWFPFCAKMCEVYCSTVTAKEQKQLRCQLTDWLNTLGHNCTSGSLSIQNGWPIRTTKRVPCPLALVSREHWQKTGRRGQSRYVFPWLTSNCPRLLLGSPPVCLSTGSNNHSPLTSASWDLGSHTVPCGFFSPSSAHSLLIKDLPNNPNLNASLCPICQTTERCERYMGQRMVAWLYHFPGQVALGLNVYAKMMVMQGNESRLEVEE